MSAIQFLYNYSGSIQLTFSTNHNGDKEAIVASNGTYQQHIYLICINTWCYSTKNGK